MANPLNDREFLLQIDQQHQRDVYARITLLTFQETPIEYIEGKITAGTINVDGSSAVRRTCSLTMVTLEDEVNIFYMGIDRKFKLEIGLANTVDSSYPDIIWFPMGVYVTTSLATAHQTSGYTITIGGKDKMCLLNGDVAGGLPSSVDFATLETVSADGTTITYDQVKVKDIIFNAVETYGNELPYNIIINDMEDCGYELLEYKGDTPMYVFVNTTTNYYDNFTLDTKVTVTLDGETKTIAQLEAMPSFYFNQLVDSENDGQTPTEVKALDGETTYTIAKIENGNTVGYRQTDVTYGGELIGNIGDSITSILDKIIKMLGNFEYFYDLDGHFVLQKKRTYQYEKWNPRQYEDEDDSGEVLFEPNRESGGNIFYSFEDNNLISSLNNTPNLLNVRNDFSIWGSRTGVSGAEIDIHLRYALDTKPTKYVTYDYRKNHTLPTEVTEGSDNAKQWTYIAGEDGSYDIDKENCVITCDWREILYQMALDYHKYNDVCSDFYQQIATNTLDGDGLPMYPDGRTHYEQYYTDMIGFWRDIFTPETKFYRQCLLTNGTYIKNEYYTKETVGTKIVDRFPVYNKCSDATYDDEKIYYEIVDEITDDGQHFSNEVIKYPDQLSFWIDFYDSQISDIGKYSVKAIGQRSKNVKDEDVTAIYFRETPQLIFVNQDDDSVDDYGERNSAYTYVNSNTSLENCMVISSQKKSAWDVAQEYLNTYTAMTESLSFVAIPVYYLKPNVRISLKDNISKMNGEYLVDKISYSLAYNGTMSVSATKLIENIT